MSLYLFVFAIVVILCVLLNKLSGKLGIPVLLFFLLLGVLFGIKDAEFADRNSWLVGDISTIALIFIMFYGGYGTRWKSAKPIVREASLLATVGVALTAGFLGLFCHFCLKWGWIESFLMGSVISSTDAASVFSILRTRKTGLKNNTAPLIEMESGSNDPMSYMLTTIMLSMLAGTISASAIVWDVVAQLLFGVGGGLAIAYTSKIFLKKFHFRNDHFDLLLFVSIAILSYTIPSLIGGNGFLSAYIVGIFLGNTDYPGKKSLVVFFDAVTNLMQIIIFFLLGMLAVPSALLKSLVPAVLMFIFLTLVARPLAVGCVLAPFKKYPLNQMGLISFVGLRGAASIVFAIMVLNSGHALNHDIFSIVFCIVLISIALQGSLIPYVARFTHMTDSSSNVMTTFSDFEENDDMSLGSITISPLSTWKNKTVRELSLPHDCLILMVIRGDKRIVPDGGTILCEGDEVILCTKAYKDKETENLVYKKVPEKWVGSQVKHFPNEKDSLLVLLQRGGQRIIPNGETVLKEGDTMVTLNRTYSSKSNSPTDK